MKLGICLVVRPKTIIWLENFAVFANSLANVRSQRLCGAGCLLSFGHAEVGITVLSFERKETTAFERL